MKKSVFAVLAVIISIGIIIIATVGFNVDVIYSKHDEARVYVGKEYNENEIKEIVKEVIPNQKVIINKVEKFNDSFVIKAKDISKEQVESLKQKISEKYQIEDTTNTVTLSKVGNVRIRDLIKPYIVPVLVSTIIILAYMGVRYKKFGSAKIIIETAITLIIFAALYLSFMAITRCPINELFVPVGLTIYVLAIIANNIKLVKLLPKIENKKEQKA